MRMHVDTIPDGRDRLPYVTDIATGAPSSTPALNDVHNNFIVANYAADGGCLDNDDGSAYYEIHHNFCVFGGHKQVPHQLAVRWCVRHL